MTDELKNSLIGKHISAIDSVFDSESKTFKDENVIIEVISFAYNNTVAIVKKINHYSEPIAKDSKFKIEFDFPEKLELDIATNKIKPRQKTPALFEENRIVFVDLMEKAIKKLQDEHNLIYVYRHSGPACKAIFTNTLLVGVVETMEEAQALIKKDLELYKEEANEVDSRPQKCGYSIMDKTIYLEKEEGMNGKEKEEK